MLAIRATIERFTSNYQPGFVECSLVDAAGRTHLFEEKFYVVTEEELDARSEYPRPGVIPCEVVGTRTGPDGHEWILVDTEQPWCVRSREAETRFEVLREQLVELPDRPTT